MNWNANSELSSFKIPQLPMVIREAFAVYHDGLSDLGRMTIGTLAEKAKLPLEGVLQRLESIETMAEDVEISALELQKLIQSGAKNLYLLDVREPWEANICQIEGSHLMANLDLAKIFPGLKELDVITICHHGVRSLSAAFYLKEAGLPRVRSLHGGVEAWACEIDSSMARY